MAKVVMSRACWWVLALLSGACTQGPDASIPASPATASQPSSSERAASPASPTGDARVWIARQRLKGWALLESVAVLPFPSKPGPWHTEIETFAQDEASERGVRAASMNLAPGGVVLFDPLERQGVQTPMFPLYEATFYNPSAYEHIRAQGLYRNDAAARLVAQKRREITEFPDRSTVLKTFWRPVPKSDATERQAYVGIWKWRDRYVQDDAERVDEAVWQSITGRKPECVVEKAPANGCLIADQLFVTARAGDFSRIRCVQNGKCPEKIEMDQTLILVAFHIADKSLPDWFWATFWWKGVDRTRGDAWTCDNAQRPSSLNTGVWSNYSMDVGPSFILEKPPIGSEIATCGTPGKIGTLKEEFYATYNPFVEGVVRLGRKSSCLDCHARASSSKTRRQGEIPEVDWINRFYPDLRFFENHMRTDYMWTLTRYMGTTPLPSYSQP